MGPRSNADAESDAASFSPYHNGNGHRQDFTDEKLSQSKPTSSKTKSIAEDDLREWQTPDMPILTQRQLELSLLEIQRRNRRRRQKAEQAGNQSSKSSSIKKSREAAILVPVCTVQGIPSILFTRRSSQLSSHASQVSFPGGYYDDDLDSKEDDLWKNKLVATALREMHEELQYDIEQLGVEGHAEYYKDEDDTTNNAQHDLKSNNLPFITILGQTQPVPSMTGSKVTPIIGTINYDLPCHTTPEFTKFFPGNPDEVDWIFTVPIRDLIVGETSEPLQRWSTNYSDGKEKEKKKSSTKHEYWGPVFPIPEADRKEEGDKIWGLTAIVLRPLLRKVFRPVFGEKGLGTIDTRRKVEDAATMAKL